jgi:hypothetical protein
MFFKHVLSVPSLPSLSCFLSESAEAGPSSSEIPLKSMGLLLVYPILIRAGGPGRLPKISEKKRKKWVRSLIFEFDNLSIYSWIR